MSNSHKWVDSPYGHGSKACVYCKATWEEICVIGDVNVCEHAPKETKQATKENDDG